MSGEKLPLGTCLVIMFGLSILGWIVVGEFACAVWSVL